MTHANPNPTFWAGKRVLLTGHTGFKGAWLAYWLHQLGAQISGIARHPITQPNLFELANIQAWSNSHIQDLREAEAVATIVQRTNPDIVFHLAAQPLVRASYRDPLDTFSTNVLGTANLLDAVRALNNCRVVVVVTTDKVYRNQEQVFPYRETDPLGGHDPYSASKAAAELVVASYRDAFLANQGVAVASARAGNVIGGGDWSADRLIPDAIRAWSSQTPLTIRHPQATRPWQHVLEPLSAYLRLAERLWAEPQLADAYNFGPASQEAASVHQVITLAHSLYGSGDVIDGDRSKGPHEAGWLALETAKAQHQLGIVPRWTLKQTIEHTLNWYREQATGTPASELCAADIATFEDAAHVNH